MTLPIPTPQNFGPVKCGDHWPFTIEGVTLSSGDLQSPGVDVLFEIKQYISADSAVLVSLSVGSGVTIVAADELYIEVPSAVTELLEAGDYWYQARVVISAPSTPFKHTVQYGKIKAIPWA